jgi:pimeloyl-ACP methyl ester carboxylesterase
MKLLKILLSILLLFVSHHALAGDLDGYGVILLHGKGGSPSRGPLVALSQALEAHGAMVLRPKLAWAGNSDQPEGYLVTYPEALNDISSAINDLKARGAHKIILGGHSLGANAAIAFAAKSGKNLSGIMAIGPGHRPEKMSMNDPDITQSLKKAKEMMASHQGNNQAEFSDSNQGDKFTVTATAAAYLSYFDPDGPAVMSKNAAKLPNVPFLWVVGTQDPIFAAGSGYAFDKAPKNPRSKFIIVNANHGNTPVVAEDQIVDWLRQLN